MRRRIILGSVLAAVVGGVMLAAAPLAVTATEVLALSAVPVPLDTEDAARQQIGQLSYRGGLVLRSTNAAFGGLSGLRMTADGRVLAISDTGNWVTFQTIGRGARLVGVSGGTIAPLLDAEGRPPYDKITGDAEALEWDAATGDALVGFEQDHRLQGYRGIDPARPATFRTPATSVLRPAATASWNANGGGEALARLGDGALLWFEEEGQGADGASQALRIDGATVRQQRYTPPKGFRPTDAVRLRDGSVLVLNRRFTTIEGVAAVIVRVTPGDDMKGVEVARIAPPLTVDNMEGIAITEAAGRTYVWLVSDDNFLSIQRTLLLKFELLPATSSTAAARGH